MVSVDSCVVQSNYNFNSTEQSCSEVRNSSKYLSRKLCLICHHCAVGVFTSTLQNVILEYSLVTSIASSGATKTVRIDLS